MANENVEVARGYHERTKHSEERLRASPHYLDWENQPIPFKLYRDLEAIPLPRQLEPGTVSALRAISLSVTRETGPTEQVPGHGALARVLYYSAEIGDGEQVGHGTRHEQSVRRLRGDGIEAVSVGALASRAHLPFLEVSDGKPIGAKHRPRWPGRARAYVRGGLCDRHHLEQPRPLRLVAECFAEHRFSSARGTNTSITSPT